MDAPLVKARIRTCTHWSRQGFEPAPIGQGKDSDLHPLVKARIRTCTHWSRQGFEPAPIGQGKDSNLHPLVKARIRTCTHWSRQGFEPAPIGQGKDSNLHPLVKARIRTCIHWSRQGFKLVSIGQCKVIYFFFYRYGGDNPLQYKPWLPSDKMHQSNSWTIPHIHNPAWWCKIIPFSFFIMNVTENNNYTLN